MMILDSYGSHAYEPDNAASPYLAASPLNHETNTLGCDGDILCVFGHTAGRVWVFLIPGG